MRSTPSFRRSSIVKGIPQTKDTSFDELFGEDQHEFAQERSLGQASWIEGKTW